MDIFGVIWDQLLSFGPPATRALTHVDAKLNATLELACVNAAIEGSEVQRCMGPKAKAATSIVEF